MRKTKYRLAAAFALSAFAFTGAADAQLKAIRTQTNITPAERKQGDEAHPQLLAEFGGAYNGPQAAYVNRIGQNIAVQSGLSRSPTDSANAHATGPTPPRRHGRPRPGC